MHPSRCGADSILLASEDDELQHDTEPPPEPPRHDEATCPEQESSDGRDRSDSRSTRTNVRSSRSKLGLSCQLAARRLGVAVILIRHWVHEGLNRVGASVHAATLLLLLRGAAKMGPKAGAKRGAKRGAKPGARANFPTSEGSAVSLMRKHAELDGQMRGGRRRQHLLRRSMVMTRAVSRLWSAVVSSISQFCGQLGHHWERTLRKAFRRVVRIVRKPLQMFGLVIEISRVRRLACLVKRRIRYIMLQPAVSCISACLLIIMACGRLMRRCRWRRTVRALRATPSTSSTSRAATV